MTEVAWLISADLQAMLTYLNETASHRKLSLYLCAGCRRITHLFFRPDSLAAVEVAEKYADGQAKLEELGEVAYWAEEATFGFEFDNEHFPCWHSYRTRVVPRLIEMGALTEAALSGGEWMVDDAVRERLLAAARLAEVCAAGSPGEWKWWPEYISKVDWPGRWLIDCVFGNPFRPVALARSWVDWNEYTVCKIAQAIYDERAFDRLPILADALEDAGCDNADILAHCRSAGPHVRGCWVVDLLLGKQ